jgi:RNA polymerase sigma factor (sigma-70 family)
LVWSVAKTFDLDSADSADVVQTTWLRLVEHLPRLHSPHHVGAWLAATTRNECLRLLRRARREVPNDLDRDQHTATEPSPEEVVLDAERRTHVLDMFARLPERCQAVLRVLASSPPPSYADAAAALGVPIGSIGPTRARCLERLRGLLEAGVTHDHLPNSHDEPESSAAGL